MTDTDAPVAPAEVDGVAAGKVVAPHSVEELTNLLAKGSASREAVVFRTNATKLEWGMPPARLDTVVDLSGLPPLIEHSAGDLVVRVSASVGLAELNAELAKAGQRLAIDEVVPGSSIGGVIATGLSGPLRFAFGSVRDLLIGITVARADGSLARSGGSVVKNVAGYDLGKLFTGSYGTLGAIVEAYFRLHPLPVQRRWYRAELHDAATAAHALRRLAAATFAPAAIELDRPPGAPYAVTVLLEGGPRSVTARAEELAGLGIGDFAEATVSPMAFGALPGRATVKATFAPGAVANLLAALEAPAARATLSGPAAVGVVYLGVDHDGELAPLLAAAREVATGCGGSATVLRAPAAARSGLDVFGPVPAPELQRAVKASFDPGHRLAPGRFVGER